MSEPNSDFTYSVLIVDDSDEDRFLLKRFLKKTELSLEILEVNSGQGGIDLLTQPIEKVRESHPKVAPPVILFLDINMPLMNGWEFVEHLETRQKEIVLNPTVVIMYSTGGPEYETNSIDDFDTINGYIVKGDSTPEDLRQAIIDAYNNA